MKFILEIDGIESTRYKYNLWSTWENPDRRFDADVSADARIEHEDDLGLFLIKLRHRLQEADLYNQNKKETNDST